MAGKLIAFTNPDKRARDYFFGCNLHDLKIMIDRGLNRRLRNDSPSDTAHPNAAANRSRNLNRQTEVENLVTAS